MKFFGQFGSRKSTSGFTLVELLLVVCIIGLLAAFIVPGFAPRAMAQSGPPLGADVITSATPPVSTNISVAMTNSSNSASNVSATVTYVATNSAKRVRCVIYPDASYNAFIGYADTIYTNAAGTLYTNNQYLAGTTGHSLRAGANGTLSSAFVIQRPSLWKDAISITVTSTLASNAAATATFKLIDENGSY